MTWWRDWGYRARRRTVVLGVGVVVLAVAVWLVVRIEPTKPTFEPTAVEAVYGFLSAFNHGDQASMESRACSGSRSIAVNHFEHDLSVIRSMSVDGDIGPETPYEDEIFVVLSTVTRAGKPGSAAMGVVRQGRCQWCVWDLSGSFDALTPEPSDPPTSGDSDTEDPVVN